MRGYQNVSHYNKSVTSCTWFYLVLFSTNDDPGVTPEKRFHSRLVSWTKIGIHFDWYVQFLTYKSLASIRTSQSGWCRRHAALCTTNILWRFKRLISFKSVGPLNFKTGTYPSLSKQTSKGVRDSLSLLLGLVQLKIDTPEVVVSNLGWNLKTISIFFVI